MTSVADENGLKMYQYMQWCDILNDTGIEREILLAGGAVRDLINNRRIADLDIYMTSPPLHKWPALSRELRANGLKQAMKETDDASEVGDSPINAVYIDDSKSINLIFLAHGLSVMDHVDKHFDIGLCKATMNPSGLILTHKDFREDYEQKSLTWTFTEDMTNFSIVKSLKHHLPKIRRKYSDYNLIIKPDVHNPVPDWESFNE